MIVKYSTADEALHTKQQEQDEGAVGKLHGRREVAEEVNASVKTGSDVPGVRTSNKSERQGFIAPIRTASNGRRGC